MIRSELVVRIAEQNPHLYAKEVEAMVDGDRVELRGFGSFEVRRRDARDGRNPRTGEVVAVEARASVHFKPARAMRVRLNLEKVGPEKEAECLLQAL